MTSCVCSIVCMCVRVCVTMCVRSKNAQIARSCWPSSVASCKLRETARLRYNSALIHNAKNRTPHPQSDCTYKYTVHTPASFPWGLPVPVWILCIQVHVDASRNVSIQHCKPALAGYGSVAFIGCKQCICVGGPETAGFVSVVCGLSVLLSVTRYRGCAVLLCGSSSWRD